LSVRFFELELMMNFGEWAKQQADAGLAEVHTLTELQHAEAGPGPWKIYIYGRDGYHSGGKWFRKGNMKYPEEEITLAAAEQRSKEAFARKKEVRVCDGGDMLVFHAVDGKVIYGDNFWSSISS
jgi:hypothetical protein